MGEPSMIGLSVSRCVADIVKSKVKIEDVEKIVGGTSARDEASWDLLMKQYCQKNWSEWPDEAERVCRALLAQNKIEQPRLTGGRRPLVTDSHWVASEDQIKWSD